ncbi:MAG: hypothetical protein U9N87_07140, partial [Planctomycetota bacterium]|nr:hypothetical protein [Planctomycetota bacterium]
MDHNHAKRLAAKKALKYLPVEFNENQIESISRGLATAVQEIGLCVFSCAIMPDHVHFVYALHKRKNGSLVGQLKSRATKQHKIESCPPYGGEAT